MTVDDAQTTGPDEATGRQQPLAAVPAVSEPPWPLLTANYLWWASIGLMALEFGWIIFAIAEAARIGGPAIDILLTVGAQGLALAVCVAAGIPLAVRFRRGGRTARVGIAIVAGIGAMACVLLGIQGLAIAVFIAIVGITALALSLHRRSRAYFRRA